MFILFEEDLFVSGRGCVYGRDRRVCSLCPLHGQSREPWYVYITFQLIVELMQFLRLIYDTAVKIVTFTIQ